MKKAKQKPVLMAAVLIVIIEAFFLVTELQRLEESTMEMYCQQEQQYMALQSKQLQVMLEAEKTQKEIVQYMETDMPVSGSFYYFLVRNDSVIFARNSVVTKELGASQRWDVFQKKLNDSQICCITEAFSVQEVDYIVGKVVDCEYIADYAGVTRFEVYGMITLTVTILILLAAISIYAWWLMEERKKRHKLEIELKDKNILMEQEKDDGIEQNAEYDMQEQLNEAKQTGRFRQYCFSFYLNATHAIYIDGKKGQVHPHTWEITLHLLCTKKHFMGFHEVERRIERYMERYQDKCLNEVAPFNAMNPTLENCCEIFKNKLKKIVEKEGLGLLMIEIKESPSRAYVINLVEDVNRL